MNQDNLSNYRENPRQYQITVQEHLNPRWSEWFENLNIIQKRDGTTSLSGPVADQAALYGLLNKLRDMGLTLLSVELLASEN